MFPNSEVYAIVDVRDRAQRAAKHRLVDATRELIGAVALLDGATDPDAIEDLRHRIASISELVQQLPSHRHSGLALAPMPDRVIAERSPFCGRSNPLAPPLRIELEGHETVGRAIYTAAYEGPPGFAHGGVVAAAFDTLFGVAHRAAGVAAVTGTLTVIYHRSTPLHRPVDYVAGVAAAEGRKVRCWARSTCEDTLLATAECVFVVPTTPVYPTGTETAEDQ